MTGGSGGGQLVMTGNGTWTTLDVIGPTFTATIPITSLVVDGHQIPIRNGAADLTIDGAGHVSIATPYIESHPMIAWHTVKRTMYDGNGAVLSSATHTHWYNGDQFSGGYAHDAFCHPNLISDTGAPAEYNWKSGT